MPSTVPLCLDEVFDMNLKELVSAISQQEGIPASKVRKIIEAVVDQIKYSIEHEEDLRLQQLIFKTKTIQPREATETTEARPEIKRTIVRIKKAKARIDGESKVDINS